MPASILDDDEDGHVLEIKILDASKRATNPQSLEWALAG
jgi:hypothetical protein